jgi:hypothetical protein
MGVSVSRGVSVHRVISLLGFCVLCTVVLTALYFIYYDKENNY